MSREVDSLQRAGLIAENWRHFETDMLPKIAADLPAELKDSLRMSFYFGSLMMLNIVQPLSERVARQDQLEAALAAFKEEIQAFLMSQTKG